MDEKDMEFQKTYFENFNMIEEKNGLIRFKNESGKGTYGFKKINILKEDRFLKNINSLFFYKILIDNEFKYRIYFKDEKRRRIRVAIKENLNNFSIYNIDSEKKLKKMKIYLKQLKN